MEEHIKLTNEKYLCANQRNYKFSLPKASSGESQEAGSELRTQMADSTLPSSHAFFPLANKIMGCQCCPVEILKGFFFLPRLTRKFRGNRITLLAPVEQPCGRSPGCCFSMYHKLLGLGRLHVVSGQPGGRPPQASRRMMQAHGGFSPQPLGCSCASDRSGAVRKPAFTGSGLLPGTGPHFLSRHPKKEPHTGVPVSTRFSKKKNQPWS